MSAAPRAAKQSTRTAKRKANVGTFTQSQVDDMIAKAVFAALQAKPKEPMYFKWLQIAAIVIVWFAQMCFEAGYYGQRLNSLEAAVHDLSGNTMPANTIQAKFDETNHMQKVQQDELTEIAKEVHELNGRK